MPAGCRWAGRRFTLDTPVLPTGPGQHARGRPGNQPLPARQPHSQRSGSASRGPRSPWAPRCGTPAHLGNSLLGKGHLRPSLGVPHCPCPGLHGRPDLSRPYSLSPSGLHPLTHHHTQGSRCLGGAGQGMGTGWCILAGGTGCGPPGTRQSGQDKGPSELSQLTETVLSPAIHLLDIVMT